MIDGVLHCHICSSSRLKPRPFGYRFKGNWLGGIQCTSCGIIFLHPQPAAEDLKQMYSKDYFEGDFRCGHAESYFDGATLECLADYSILERIKRHKAIGKFLEIGCAGGAFLNAAQRIGYEVQGVEFSEEAAQFARQKFSLNVVAGDVGSARFPDEAFDVIYMGDVMEHLPNPLATLREINRIIAREGLLVLECPTQTNALFSRLGFVIYSALDKKVTVQLPPYHLFEFRRKSLTSLLHRCGFKIVRSVESILSPKEIALRGSVLQRIGKRLFQYPNYFITTILGILGDRIEIFATKAND